MKKVLILIFLFLSFIFFNGCTNIKTEFENNTYRITLYDNINDKTYHYNIDGEFFMCNDFPLPTHDKYEFLGWNYIENSEDYLKNNIKYHIESDISLYSSWANKKIDYNDFFIVDNVGTFFLNTNDAITSKETYISADVGIKSNNYSLSKTSAKVRLRGNSSLNAPKKSYKIKFDEKQNVFNMGSDKEWALIANYFDSSLLRNYYAYRLAEAMNIPYSIETKFVELYLNGVNQGLYLFTETVKTGSNRVDIEVDYNSNDLQIPFLLELDYKMIEETDIASNGIKDVDYFIYDNYINNYKRYPFGTKYPKDFTKKSITESQYQYIKTYIDSVYHYVTTDDYDKYLDINSAINFFIIEELFMNIDQDYSSVFMYKAINKKLQFGPVWDFDISSGNCNYVSNYDPYHKMKEVNGGNYIFYQLLEHKDFQTAFMFYLNQLGDEILPGMFNSMDANYEILKAYANDDNQIWSYLNRSFWPKPNELVGITYQEQVEYLKKYLQEHYNWMLNNM